MMKKKNKMLDGCPDCIIPGTDGKMPIVGYNGPTGRYMQERYMQLISECGINLLTFFEYDYTTHPEEYHQLLEWCEKYGIFMHVNDVALHPDMTEEELSARIAKYGKYKSFAGIHIMDEPCNDVFPVSFEGAQKLRFHPMHLYSAISKRLNSYDNMMGYINLLPHYYWMECYLEDYRNYLEEYIETCDPKIISYDHYVFDDRDRKRAMKWFFQNLLVVREYSLKSGIPFWVFIQAGSQWGPDLNPRETETYRPTKYELFWNVNVVLAFGCKGVEYYPLVQPYDDALYLDGGLDCDRGGILGADGEPTMYHGFIRQINNQVNAVGSILMKCENKGVLAIKNATTYVEGKEGILDSDGYKELVSVSCRTAGVFVGCFDYEGKTALYVVNNDTKKCQNVTLHFDNTYHLEFVSYAHQGQEDTNVLKITLGAGNAMLVVVS